MTTLYYDERILGSIIPYYNSTGMNDTKRTRVLTFISQSLRLSLANVRFIYLSQQHGAGHERHLYLTVISIASDDVIPTTENRQQA